VEETATVEREIEAAEEMEKKPSTAARFARNLGLRRSERSSQKSDVSQTSADMNRTRHISAPSMRLHR